MARRPVCSSASSSLGNCLRDQSSPSRGQWSTLHAFIFYVHVSNRTQQKQENIPFLLCRELLPSFLAITTVCAVCPSLRREGRRGSTWPTCASWAPTPSMAWPRFTQTSSKQPCKCQTCYPEALREGANGGTAAALFCIICVFAHKTWD